MTPPEEERPAVIWRLPRWEPAVLFLVTAALAGYAIYGGGSGVVIGIVALLAVAFFVAAVAAARMYLIADDDGIGIRRYTGESSLTWDRISGIAVAKQRGGALTLEIQAPDATALTVPPSLVLPLRPTGIARTTNLLGVKAQELRERRPHGSIPPVAQP
ncbi:hypothetical protein ACXR2U_11000 [Jatrophihabitans sp. YIM 134969]